MLPADPRTRCPSSSQNIYRVNYPPNGNIHYRRHPSFERTIRNGVKKANDSIGVGALMRRFIKAADTVFDPDTVDILVGAFDDAWASLVNKSAAFAAENNAK